MSALKSLIIALPAKSTPAATTAILVDKIKLEAETQQQQQQQHHHHHMGLARIQSVTPEQQQKQQQQQQQRLVLKQENLAPASRGKKRRLDHLTWEEKLQRKKLKNRVAAQTSRDRKKAKLDELEESVKVLKENNEMLTEECANLRTQNELLISEMKKLKQDKELLEKKNSNKQMCSMCQARVDCTVPVLGSAVSPMNPLQQGGTAQTAPAMTSTPSTIILLKILSLFLLSKTYLANSKETVTLSDSKNLLKAFCERLPLKWKQVLLDPTNRTQWKKKSPTNLTLEKKWWGRHQVMWKPMQPVEA